MPPKSVIFRVHAVQQMFSRGISELEVRDVLESGIVVEEYPDDSSFPAKLQVGWIGCTSVHVVSLFDSTSDALHRDGACAIDRPLDQSVHH